MMPQPPPGQGPIDPRGAFGPPTPPGQGQAPVGGGPLPPPPQFGQAMYPPPGFMPPPMYMPPPPRGGRGFARGIFVTLATTIFGLSLTLNLYLLLAHGVFSSSSSRESTIIDGDVTQKIAVIPIQGIIANEAAERFARLISAAENEGVKAIVLEIDSPGGTVSASDEIYHRILRFKKDHSNTPVVATMGGLAASGGYYVACAADYVYAQPTTLTGNIGVLFPLFNVSKLCEKWGIEEETITATGATYKNAGSMFQPLSREHRDYLQDLADQAFEQFKEVVRSGRHFSDAQVTAVANGKIFTAADAKAKRLVDDIGYSQDAYDYVAGKLGLSRKTVIRYEDPPSLLRDLLSSQANPPAEGKSGVTINGVKVDASGLRELMTPRLMYLWRGQ